MIIMKAKEKCLTCHAVGIERYRWRPLTDGPLEKGKPHCCDDSDHERAYTEITWGFQQWISTVDEVHLHSIYKKWVKFITTNLEDAKDDLHQDIDRYDYWGLIYEYLFDTSSLASHDIEDVANVEAAAERFIDEFKGKFDSQDELGMWYAEKEHSLGINSYDWISDYIDWSAIGEEASGEFDCIEYNGVLYIWNN